MKSRAAPRKTKPRCSNAKIATSFMQGSGAIEWLWNTNSYMTESNETPIGAVRTDYTEKPEATVLRAFATVRASAAGASCAIRNCLQSRSLHRRRRNIRLLADFQLEAQRNAVRALAYYDHLIRLCDR